LVVDWNAGTVLLVPSYGCNKKDRPGVPSEPNWLVLKLKIRWNDCGSSWQ